MKVLTASQFLVRDLPFMIKKYHERGFPPHRHEFLEFFYVNSGSGIHHLDSGSSALAPGDLVILSPEHEHSFSVIEGESLEITVCIFTPAFLASAAGHPMDSVVADIFLRPFDTPGYERMRLSGKADMKVRSLLAEMIDEYGQRQSGYRIALTAKLTDLLITIVRTHEADAAYRKTHASSSKKAHAVFDVVSYITDNFRQRISLDTVVSEHTDMTKEYFCVLFKRATGKTFVQYLTDIRLEHAKKLLTSASLSVTEVCFDSGFNDLSHFERTFRRAAGASPRQYQRRFAPAKIRA